MWKMLCYLQGQGHSLGSYYRFFCLPHWWSLCNQTQFDGTQTTLWKDIGLQSRVHNDCSTSPIFSVLLCNQNRCDDLQSLMSRPSANKLDIRVDRNSDLHTTGGILPSSSYFPPTLATQPSNMCWVKRDDEGRERVSLHTVDERCVVRKSGTVSRRNRPWP